MPAANCCSREAAGGGGARAARLAALADGLPAGTTNVLVSIRAEDVILLQADGSWQTSARNRLAGTVRTLASEGATVRIELDCGFPLVAVLTRQAADELGLAVGGQICALVKAPNVHLIPRAWHCLVTFPGKHAGAK